MSWWSPQWTVRLLHIPTGEEVTLTSHLHRSMFAARNKGLSLLRSKVRFPQKELKEVAVYELPDEVQYPNELGKYRNAGELK